MKLFFLSLFFIVLFQSCSIQKMRYSRGFNISFGKYSTDAKSNKKRIQVKTKSIILKPLGQNLVSMKYQALDNVKNMSSDTMRKETGIHSTRKDAHHTSNANVTLAKRLPQKALDPIEEEQPIEQENVFSYFSRLLCIASIILVILLLLLEWGGWFIPAFLGFLGVLFGLIGLCIKYFRHEKLRLKDFVFIISIPLIIIGIALWVQSYIIYD